MSEANSINRLVRCEDCQHGRIVSHLHLTCAYPRERPPVVVDMSYIIDGVVMTDTRAARECSKFTPNAEVSDAKRSLD